MPSESNFNKVKAASKRACGSLLTHKASGSRFNEVKRTKDLYAMSKVNSSSTRRRGEVAVYRRRGAVNSTATMFNILDKRTKEQKRLSAIR